MKELVYYCVELDRIFILLEHWSKKYFVNSYNYVYIGEL